MKKDKRVRGIYKKFPDEIKIRVCKDHYDNHMSYQELGKKYGLYTKSGKLMKSTMLGWFRLYRKMGEAAFLVHRQGNRQYTKDGEPRTETTKKRIKELREENEKLRLQIEYLKKLNALVRENRKKEKSIK
ncbi:MAG: hypothetical protein WCX85_01810 [Bacilli bacterium]|jgi:transposase|nr:hypothetical protein [Bacilli bacterium]